MNFSRSRTSWLQCWGMNRMNSVHWVSNRIYCSNWGLSSILKRRYRSVHWSDGI